ncbi:hypothetical protein WJX81_007535 [Elliptochloris bilobata]|uniref:RING-type E3 ubiquitin transferase n=1 Tax=Elliptochloris bilobata TaxID=381761 RepID=A0AAW1R236_9CHLO
MKSQAAARMGINAAMTMYVRSGAPPQLSEQPATPPPPRRRRGSGEGGSTDPAAGLCGAYTLSGRCGKRACHLVHGTVCPSCGKWALHPYNVEEAARHADECAARHERLAAAARSADIECAICLERVLATRGRKFGLLENCDHAFCLACIRSWRATAEAGLAGDTAVRCCPLCRQLSWFVTPSAIWPNTAEAKAATISAYKAKLATINCRMFAAGAGTCPHGTSCFYRHAYPDGRLEEKTLRRNVDADGDVHVVRSVCLSDFIQASAAAHRALRRRAA